jgi:hypothetical protein
MAQMLPCEVDTVRQRNNRKILAVASGKVSESVIFVDKIDNFPFMETARELTFLKEFKSIDE